MWTFSEQKTLGATANLPIKFSGTLNAPAIQFHVQRGQNYTGQCGWIELETVTYEQILYEPVFYNKRHIFKVDTEYGNFKVRFVPNKSFSGGTATVKTWDSNLPVDQPESSDFDSFICDLLAGEDYAFNGSNREWTASNNFIWTAPDGPAPAINDAGEIGNKPVLRFDSSDYLQRVGELWTHNAKRTIACMFKVNSDSTGERVLFSLWPTNSDDEIISLKINDTDSFKVWLRPQSSDTITNVLTSEQNYSDEWFIAIVAANIAEDSISATVGRAYSDDKSYVTAQLTGSNSFRTADRSVIGADRDLALNFQGAIRYFAFFNECLDEVTQYNLMKSIKYHIS